MRVVGNYLLVNAGGATDTELWQRARQDVLDAVESIRWPLGSDGFTIRPEKNGNGVKPIRTQACNLLHERGWTLEHAWPDLEQEIERQIENGEELAEAPPEARRARPGKVDAALLVDRQQVAFEWETGNVSSSHRSINKLCMGVQKGIILGGFHIVPSRALYRYLTDRIGNVDELEPYFDFWGSVPCTNGAVEMIVVEHNATDDNVERIPKGTDGRANI